MTLEPRAFHAGKDETMKTAEALTGLSEARRPTTAALWLCLASVGFSLVLRVLYLAQQWRIDMSEHPTFLAAEGIVGLMGRHILAGARPLFYYGQYYMGALEAYLAAGLFHLFGESMTTLRAVPTVFAVTWIPLAGVIAARLYGRRAGLLAAALVALPSQFVFEWGFQARGGHAEHVTLVLLTLYLVLLALEHAGGVVLVALGFVVGFSFWVNQLAVAYLPVYAYALTSWGKVRQRQAALLLVAGVIGISPLIYGNIIQPLGTVRAVASKARASWSFSAKRALATDSEDEERYYRALPLFQVLGAQPRRDGAWSPVGTAGAVILTLGGLGSCWAAYRRREQDQFALRRHVLMLGFVSVSLLLGIGGFCGQQVGRYQLVLYPLLCVLAVGWLEQTVPRWATLGVGLLALGQGLQLLTPIPADARTSPGTVVESLLEHGLRYGYGADNMYDLVFESGERVVIEPLEWSRYGPYQAKVAAADQIFYLYRDDQQRKPSFRAFMGYLAEMGVTYHRLDIGEYHALYDFEPRGDISAQAIAKLRDQIREQKERPTP